MGEDEILSLGTFAKFLARYYLSKGNVVYKSKKQVEKNSNEESDNSDSE